MKCFELGKEGERKRVGGFERLVLAFVPLHNIIALQEIILVINLHKTINRPNVKTLT